MVLIHLKKIGFKTLINIKTLIAICALLLFTQCQNKPEEIVKQAMETEEDTVTFTDAQFKNAPIETVMLSEKNIGTVLKLNGKVDVPPQSLVSVSVPLGGYLKSSKLLPGTHVNKGEIIAIMEDPQYITLQQEYLQAKSKLQFAALDYKRQRELNESKASSEKVMQQAQAEMNNQRITMNALAQQLRLININPEQLNENTISKSAPVRSQINGYVSKVNVNIGKYVNPADVLFELIDPTDIHLNLTVYEKDISKLAIGQKLMAYSNTDPSKKYEGEVLLISKDISNEGFAEVHCHFEQYNKNLLPGTYMNAIIETKTSFSFALPEESIVSFQGKDYVFVELKKQTYKMMQVKTAEKENGFLQIINHSDFKDKKIVTKNAYTLLMKLKNMAEEE